MFFTCYIKLKKGFIYLWYNKHYIQYRYKNLIFKWPLTYLITIFYIELFDVQTLQVHTKNG